MDKEIRKLLELYARGECTPDQVEFVEMTLFGPDGNPKAQTEGEAYAETEVWTVLNAAIRKQTMLRRVRRIAYYSSAAAVLVFAVFVFKSNHRISPTEPIIITNVAPGKNQAFLVLSNGKKVYLDTTNGSKIATEAGVKIYKDSSGTLVYDMADVESASANTRTINTVETPRGGSYQVTLSDGTKVWLNAASSISFPVKFNSGIREVTTTGECYFEVTRMSHKPFIVKSAGQVIEVLGTKFNVNAYSDEPGIKTVLLEGSVRIGNGRAKQLLKPGQQAFLSAEEFTIGEAPTHSASWRKGIIRFKDAQLKEILREAGRWYDLDVVYSGSISSRQITFAIPRSVPLTQFLKALGDLDIDFKLTEKNNGEKTLTVIGYQ
ncbi:FecR domain-containing protein [Chitinophaga horti]|uniref:FecR domain-containing protein n=1 Tax=Chitinophaga horti TaxID=2920382 RepID=A0ABY6IXV3_9BACT|nr:FecR family protein [Chitinophaga horti]UYQ92209.1 FecR domain-containing protein [Chitinophaga horti]